MSVISILAGSVLPVGSHCSRLVSEGWTGEVTGGLQPLQLTSGVTGGWLEVSPVVCQVTILTMLMLMVGMVLILGWVWSVGEDGPQAEGDHQGGLDHLEKILTSLSLVSAVKLDLSS